MRGFRHRVALAIVAAGWAVFAAPAAAQQTSAYHPDAESRVFATSAGGWTGSSGSEGPCVASFTCPSVTNSFQANDGTGGVGDGFLRTAVGSSLTGVTGEVTGIWESPTFTYQGAGGDVPDEVQLVLDRRADVAAFASSTGSTVDYTVEILNVTAGTTAAVPVDHLPMTDSDSWVPVGPFAVEPDQLTAGQQYMVRITSRFSYDGEVLPSGSIDYDNIALEATTLPGPAPGPAGPPGPSGPSGGGGKPGGQGKPGKPGGNKLDVAFLNSFIKNNTRNWVGLRGNRALVFVRCPGRAKQEARFCRFQLTALLKRSGPAASGTVTRKLAPRGKGVVGLPLRSAFRGKLVQKPTLLVRYRVQVGKIKTTVFKQLRVVRCAKVASC